MAKSYKDSLYRKIGGQDPAGKSGSMNYSDYQALVAQKKFQQSLQYQQSEVQKLTGSGFQRPQPLDSMTTSQLQQMMQDADDRVNALKLKADASYGLTDARGRLYYSITGKAVNIWDDKTKQAYQDHQDLEIAQGRRAAINAALTKAQRRDQLEKDIGGKITATKQELANVNRAAPAFDRTQSRSDLEAELANVTAQLQSASSQEYNWSQNTAEYNDNADQIWALRNRAKEIQQQLANWTGDEDRLGAYLATTAEDRANANAIASNQFAGLDGQQMSAATTWANGDAKHWDLLTEDEINQYYWLRQNRGQDKADIYLEGMQRDLNKRFTEGVNSYGDIIDGKGKVGDTGIGVTNAIGKALNTKTGFSVASSAGTIMTNTIGGVMAGLDDLAHILTGRDVDPYNNAHIWQNYSGAARGAVAQEIVDAFGEDHQLMGALASNAYQGIMSGLDSGVYGVLGLGTPAYSIAMGLGAGSQRAKELYEAGASKAQIAIGAIASGLIEQITEEYSMEKFSEAFLKKRINTPVEFLAKLCVQGFNEGSEEVASELLNMMVNAVLLGQNSDNQQEIRQLMEEGGLSYAEANSRARLNRFLDCFWAFYGGFISGGAMGMVGGAVNLQQTRSQNRAIGSDVMKAGTRQQLVEQAKATEGFGKTDSMNLFDRVDAKRQQRLMDRVAADQKANDTSTTATRRAGNLMYDLQQHQKTGIQNTEKNVFRAAAAAELTKKGVKESAQGTMLDTLTKAAYGEELTKSEQQLMKHIGGDEIINKVAASEDFLHNAIEATKDQVKQATQTAQLRDDVRNRDDERFEVSTDGKTQYTNEKGETMEAKVASIAGFQDGEMMLNLEGGQTVKASSVSYGSDAEAVLYHAIATATTDAKVANDLLSIGLQSGEAVSRYAGYAIREMYQYGKLGVPMDKVSASFSDSISQDQAKAAYDLGRTQYTQNYSLAEAGKKQNASSQKRGARKQQNAYKGVEYGNGVTVKADSKGNVTAINVLQKDGSTKTITLDDKQRQTIQTMEFLAAAGLDVRADWSEDDTVRGGYSRADGSLHFNLNGKMDGKHAGAYTIAHELTHFMEDQSPAEYREFQDAMFAALGKTGASVQNDILKTAEAIAKKHTERYSGGIRAARQNEALWNQLMTEARSEVVARTCETMLTDTNAAQQVFDKLNDKQPGLVQKIVNFLRDFISKLQKAYEGMDPTSPIAIQGKAAIYEMTDLADKWSTMLVNSIENYRTASIDTMTGTNDGAPVQTKFTQAVEAKPDLMSEATEVDAFPKISMSLSDGSQTPVTWIPGLKPTMVKGVKDGPKVPAFTGRQVRENAMKKAGYSDQQTRNVTEFMAAMGDVMKEAGVTFRFIGLQDVQNAVLHYSYNADGSVKSIVLSAMVKNGDYPVNFDLSSICKKRAAMSGLMDVLANRGDLDNGSVKLAPGQIFEVNKALKDAGYETACLGCFVESKRYNNMAWAKKFCDKWNKAVKAVNPNATEFGYGSATFQESDITLEDIQRMDEAVQAYRKTAIDDRLENAMQKYRKKAEAGEQLVKGKTMKVDGEELYTFSKAARDRLIKADMPDDLKNRYLTMDISELELSDVEYLLQTGVLTGANLSNVQTIKAMVASGEQYQHLIRPSDLLTAKGIANLEKLPNFHGVLYGHYGSGTPKLVQGFTPYNSEIAMLPDKKGSVDIAEYLYSIAGVRMQSFSDFQIQNVYDYLQMVADMAARKLPSHAYTKEISFARVLGMTGIKTNLSVMFDIDPTVDGDHAGLTKYDPKVHDGEYGKIVLHDDQGDWVYNIGDYHTQKAYEAAYPEQERRFLQSIGFGDAVRLQTSPGYTANCGIIGVGYSDLLIKAMLDDNRIRYIIPYHSSSLPADIKVATHIELGSDYTPYQNNTKVAQITDKDGNKVNWTVKEAAKRLGSGVAAIQELNRHVREDGWQVTTKKAQTGHGSYDLYGDLNATSDPRKTASNYIDWCASNNTLPVFSQFADHNNYYKLLYDFNVYDCVTEQYAPQGAVQNIYPTQVDGRVIPGNVTEGGFDNTYLRGVIEKQMSFMNQYGENLQRDLNTLADNLEKGKYTLADEDLDTEYFAAIESGDMQRVQQMVNDRAQKLRAEVFAATDVPTYKIRRGPAPKKTIKVYKTFTMSANGRPSALFVSSQYDLPVGVWLDAQDTYHFMDQKNGHMYVPSTKNPNTKGGATGRPTSIANISKEDIAELVKRGYLKPGKNGQLPKTITSLAYRPGWHAGDLPFFPQGGMQIEGSNYPNVHRYNQVVFECEMAVDVDYTRYEITDDGQARFLDMQEMPVNGSYKFATNPMANSSDIGAWYISGALKINRALTQEEADRILTENGRPVQEWQQYQDDAEIKNLKGNKQALYDYEHTMGPLDMDALGYDPNQTDGGKKLLDPITYDDDGNIIPLSQRFNSEIQDVRYDEDLDAEKNWPMTWGYHYGILDGHDLDRISDAIAKIRKHHYNGYNFKGKYKFVYLDYNKAAFISDSFRHPVVNIVAISDTVLSDDDFSFMKEYMSHGWNGKAKRIYENLLEDEHFRFYDFETYRADAGKVKRGKREDGGNAYKGNPVREVHGKERVSYLKIDYDRAVRYGHLRSAKKILKDIAAEMGYSGDLTGMKAVEYDEEGNLISPVDRISELFDEDLNIPDDILLEDDDLSDWPVELRDIVEPLIQKEQKRKKGTGAKRPRVIGEYNVTGTKAVMQNDRLLREIADSGAGAKQNFAGKWVTSINPSAFLDMTNGREMQKRSNFDKLEGDYGSTTGERNFIPDLKNSRQTPYLAIDLKTGKVVGHEGRHRMRSLEMAGVTSADILVEFRDKSGHTVYEVNGGNPLHVINRMEIGNQFRTRQGAILENIIPLNNAFKDQAMAEYGESRSDSDADIRYDEDLQQQWDDEAKAMEASHKYDLQQQRKELIQQRKADLSGLQRQWDDEAKAMEISHKYDMDAQKKELEAKRKAEVAAAEDRRKADIAALDKQRKAEISELLRKWDEEAEAIQKSMEYDAKQEIEAVVKGYQASRRAAVENRRRTEMRNKIKKLSIQANKMLDNTGKANNAHVVNQLRGAMAKFCDLFAESEQHALRFAEYGLTGREMMMDENNRRLGASKSRQAEAASIQRMRDRNGRKAAALAELRNRYSQIANDPQYSMYHDDFVDALLQKMSDQLAGTDIYEMNVDQLTQVYNTMRAMIYTVQNANKMHMMGRDKTLIGVAQKLSSEINQVSVNHKQLAVMARDYAMWQMSPDVFFDYICGFIKDNEGQAIQKMFENGTTRMLGVNRDFYQAFRHITETENADDAKKLKGILGNPTKHTISWGLKNAAGEDVKTSVGMMLQAYLLLSQEDSFQSLIYGGFKLPNEELYYDGKIGQSYGDAEEGQLMSEAIGQSYGDILHEIQTLRQQIEEGVGAQEAMDMDQRIEDLQQEAMDLVKGAEAHLVDVRNRIHDLIDSELGDMGWDLIATARNWYKHTGDLYTEVHTELYGFAPALVDGYVPIHRDLSTVQLDLREGDPDKAFNIENTGFTHERVPSKAPILLTDFFEELNRQQDQVARYYGFAMVQKDFNRIWNCKVPGVTNTIKGKVSAKYGQGKRGLGVSGEQYINNYIRDVAGGSQTDDILSAFYGNAASATLSLNGRVAISQLASIPTAASVVGWGSMTRGFFRGLRTATTKAGRTQLSNDSVWYFNRYRGAGGSTEFTDMQMKGTMWGKITKTPVGKALFNWCQYMDDFATGTMWAMAEDYVQQQGMKTGDEGYQDAVGQAYADIIRKSQPNYTTTERSDLLRDHRAGMKLLTMYKTQSNQNLNLLIAANGKFQRMRSDLAAGRNGVTQADVDAARKQLTNSITGVALGGNLAFVLIRTMMNFLLGKVDPYRDDETDEVTVEATLTAAGKEMISSAAGMVALGSQIYDLVESMVSGDRYYGISDSAIASISNTLESIANAAQKRDAASAWKATKGILTMCGVPVNNAVTLEKAAAAWINTLQGSSFLDSSGDTKKVQYQNRFLAAYRAGDDTKCSEILAYMVQNTDAWSDSRSEKSVMSSMKTYLKTAYIEGRVTEAEVTGILKKYFGTDAKDLVREWNGAKETGMTASEIKDAYYSKGVSSSEYVKYLTKYMGKTQAEATAAELKLRCERDEGIIFSDVDDLLLAGKLTDSKARMIYQKYGGMTAEKAAAKVDGLLWKRDVPEAATMGDITRAKYAEYCQAAGISKKAFTEVWIWARTHTKKAELVEYLRTAKLTDAQRLALWRSFKGASWKSGGYAWCPAN